MRDIENKTVKGIILCILSIGMACPNPKKSLDINDVIGGTRYGSPGKPQEAPVPILSK